MSEVAGREGHALRLQGPESRDGCMRDVIHRSISDLLVQRRPSGKVQTGKSWLHVHCRLAAAAYYIAVHLFR